MPATLRVLHLEDSRRDAEMVRHGLESGGVACHIVLVNSKAAFEASLAEGGCDLILVDYNLPGYGGIEALKYARAVQPDVPTILISGTVGEEEAVQCIHLGATDYLMKNRLGRLVPAVQRAIQDAHTQRTKKGIEAALIASESRKAAILESVLDAIITVDAEGTVLEFNAAAEGTFGYSKAAALGRPLVELIIPPRFRDRYRLWLATYSATGSAPSIGKLVEICAMRCDASEIPVELTVTAIGAGASLIFTSVLRDITARQFADLTRARLASIVDSSDDAIFGMTLDEIVQTWNAGAERLYGYAAGEIIGHSATILVPPELRADLRSNMACAARGEAGEAVETQWLRKDGSLIDISLMISPMMDSSGRIASLSSIARDITARKHGEAEVRRLNDTIERQRLHELDVAQALTTRLERASQHDGLTDLPNRTLFHDRVNQAVAQARRDHLRVAVLYVDLDRFKHINDSLGHAAGDELLKSVSSRLVRCVRGSDTVCRHGGDEFLLLLSQLHAVYDAAIVADKLIAALSEPYEIAGHTLHVTASVGISLYPDNADDAIGLISAADTAMYNAKQSGPNSCRFFTAQMNESRRARQRLEADLRDGLKREEFTLHFQPKINLDTCLITGAEALVRWQHPTRGLLAPEGFVPIAEESGLILPLGRWVLSEACRQARAWQDAGLPPIRIAVNVSALQFRSVRFVQDVAAVLAETGLDSRYLELEVTESVLVEGEATAAVLFGLRALGVRLAIDDFGTGFSSLSYLSRFPIDTLKIDRSFVLDATQPGRDASIIEAIIGLGRSLKLCVVAEGSKPRRNWNSCGDCRVRKRRATS